MSAIVADASVAIKWYVRESDSEIAQRILAAPETIHAPSLLRLELANGLWKHWRRKLVAADQVEEAVASLERTVACWHDDAALAEAALKLTLALDHPIYDCVYIALAQRLGAALVTADRRILAAAPDVAVAPGDWITQEG